MFAKKICTPKIGKTNSDRSFALEDSADQNNTDILNSGVLKYSISNFHQWHATTKFTSTIYAVTYQHFIKFQCLGSPEQEDKHYFLIPHLEPRCATLLLLGRYWNAYLMDHQREASNIYWHVQYFATTYISHSYHSNHNSIPLKVVLLLNHYSTGSTF